MQSQTTSWLLKESPSKSASTRDIALIPIHVLYFGPPPPSGTVQVISCVGVLIEHVLHCIVEMNMS